MERPKSKRAQNPLKGKSIFLESDVKRSSCCRDLLKHLTFLGAKVEEYLTPSISFVVTKDHTKCTGNNTGSNDSPGSFPSPSAGTSRSPSKGTMFESRAQKQLRLAREKSESKQPNPMPVAKTRKSTNREKIQKFYHMDRFVKWVRRHYVAQRRSSNETSPLIATGSPKPANYKSPTKPISPQKALNSRLLSTDRFPIEPRNLSAPFLKIVDISCCFRPIIMEQFQAPDLRLDPIEHNGCPFAGYDKRTERKRRRTSKDSKPKKGGSCEICDTKFEDENVHFESAQHQRCLQTKRSEFERIQSYCLENFPTTTSGLVARLNELNNNKHKSDKPEVEKKKVEQPLDVSLLSPTAGPENNDFTKLRAAENALAESTFEEKTSKSTNSSNLNESVDWMSKELGVARDSPETAQRGQEVTQNLGILSLDKSEVPPDMKRKATPAKGTYNPSQVLPEEEDRDSKSPIIFSIMNHVRSISTEEPGPEEENSPIILSKFAPLPVDIETRSPALKKACIQKTDGTNFSLETARNIRSELISKTEAEVPKTPPRSTNESPPLPAPVLSAVLVSPKEAASSPKMLATLEKCTDSSIVIVEPSSEISGHNESIEVSQDDHEVQNILHADGTVFKTPQKPRPVGLTPDPPPNEEDDLAHISFQSTPESPEIQNQKYLTLPARKASFENNSEVELVEDGLSNHSADSQYHCDANLDIIVSKTKLTKIPTGASSALRGLDFSDIIFQTSPTKQVRKSKRTPARQANRVAAVSNPIRNPTLTEKNGIYTLSAFAQQLSSSDDEVSYSNYNRRLQKRRTQQKVAEDAICGQTEYDSLFESGTINNESQLHSAVDTQILVDNLTPDSKRIFFQTYGSHIPSPEESSPEKYCPKRESSRKAKKIQNPQQQRAKKTKSTSKRPTKNRSCRTRQSPKYTTLYGFDSTDED